MKLLVVSDPHIVEPGGTVSGLDPSARLNAVLQHAAAHQPDADHLVVLGDLTHNGTPAQYAHAMQVLAQVTRSMTVMMGNHDNRDNYDPAGDFVQSVVTLGEYRLICLDTLHADAEPEHSGFLCDARLNWLRDALDGAGAAPVIIAMHHPPFDTGFDGMDRIKLKNSDAFFDVLEAHGNTVQLLCGHVHRTISGVARGVPFAVFKSSCDQMPMVLGVPGSSHSVDEPAGYGVVLTSAQGVTVHNVDVGLETAVTQRAPSV